jgi:hypothetical protein
MPARADAGVKGAERLGRNVLEDHQAGHGAARVGKRRR